MSTEKSDLLLHPVRLRIVLECSSRDVTTPDLAARMPDVPHATLYRNVSVLVDAGILTVISERRIRGGVERTLRLASDAGVLDAADAASMSPDEHLRGFTVFAGALIAAYSRYLAQPAADPSSDAVSYRQLALWLSDDELAEMVAAVGAALQPFLDNAETPERRRVLLSTVLMPDAEHSPR